MVYIPFPASFAQLVNCCKWLSKQLERIEQAALCPTHSNKAIAIPAPTAVRPTTACTTASLLKRKRMAVPLEDDDYVEDDGDADDDESIEDDNDAEDNNDAEDDGADESAWNKVKNG